jgi:cobyrinic acid a,c-diamide synthase
MAPRSCESEAGKAGTVPEPGDAARIVVAGLSGDAGKTLVSLALIRAMRERHAEVRAFKKGPDYIDAAWLSWASGRTARNLDTWLCGFEGVRGAFCRHAAREGFNVIEGNRGLFDGVDAQGTHSTAELAKALCAPVLLVVDARKATRTLAALVLGCRSLDPALDIAGVVLNRVAGGRHEAVAREAIETMSGVRVVGAIPPLDADALPGRHMGLVTPQEHPSIRRVSELALVAASHMDLEAIGAMADAAARPSLGGHTSGGEHTSVGEHMSAGGNMRCWSPSDAAVLAASGPSRAQAPCGPGGGLKIAYLRDSAFSFYYPENLEALEEAGASLVPVSSLADARLPRGIQGLYIGGGFPETHAPALAANRALLDSIRATAGHGLPVYAECGGLILLARGLWHEGRRHEMAGVLPFDVEVCPRPQGHGYETLLVDVANPFFPVGSTLKGHEFHDSRIVGEAASAAALQAATVSAVQRGTGCGSGRDAVVTGNVWASYFHLHASSVPAWAPGFVRAAHRYSRRPPPCPQPAGRFPSSSRCVTCPSRSSAPAPWRSAGSPLSWTPELASRLLRLGRPRSSTPGRRTACWSSGGGLSRPAICGARAWRTRPRRFPR